MRNFSSPNNFFRVIISKTGFDGKIRAKIPKLKLLFMARSGETGHLREQRKGDSCKPRA